CREGCDG
ncbi:hypothetical protein BN1708_019598, partial [Verticillium longisporum]